MLELLECLDSDERAERARQELWVSREKAAQLGRSAVEAISNGYYQLDSGERGDWKREVDAARFAKASIAPYADLPSSRGTPERATHVQVANETTFVAAGRLTEGGSEPLALNFANGVTPGGGFLGGARAQEEVLCRSSALFHTLVDDPMYEAHRQRGDDESSDWAILSPRVPVFRVDNGRELDEPWPLSFITCAAPYAPVVGQPASGDLLERRIHRVLSIARAHGYTSLVLGAWGCGAFENDPARTARDFRSALEGEFAGAFAEVVFAVTDWSPERKTLGPFRDVFAE